MSRSGGDYFFVPAVAFDVNNAGNWITNGTYTNLSVFSIDSDSQLRSYIEGIRPASDMTITVHMGTVSCSVWQWKDSMKLTTLKVDLVPDFNHDRTIDETNDRGKATVSNPFRFWINDDNDDEFSATSGNDWPDQTSHPDWESVSLFGQVCVVDGVRDLVDFFPVFIDLKDTLNLLGTTDYKYVLKHEENAVNALIDSGLTLSTVQNYLIDNACCEAHAHAALEYISSVGYELPSSFLNGIVNENKGVILVEGRNASDKPLVLEIIKKSDNTIIFKKEMPLSLSKVTDMYRYKNLRSESGDLTGGGASHTGDPSNNPDSLSNGKNVVFIHGFNETPDAGRGNIAETFKRLYWSGSKAKYTGVAWFGDQGTPAFAHYHWDVANAFVTAPAFAQYLSTLQGEVNVIAFSLGNMVVSSAIQDCSANPARYFMLHAAVAAEAYESTRFDPDMVQMDWRPYTNSLYASKWNTLFPTNDGRRSLTWAGRFSSAIGPQVFNYFSDGEDVLENLTTGAIGFGTMWDTITTRGEYAWAIQEMWKGRWWNLPSSWIVGGSDYGGWGFTADANYYTNSVIFAPNRACQIAANELMAVPFFNSDAPVPSLLAEPNNPTGVGSQYATANRSQILADMIPALSFATGANSLSSLNDPVNGNRNLDMNTLFKNGWPAARLSGWSNDRWLHGDYRAVAYVYVYTLFDDIVKTKGQLNQ